jgi:hypothetical protein
MLACNEQYSELCALSTTGSLSSADEERLNSHIAACAQCALLLNQYRMIADSGMAILAGDSLDREGSLPALENAEALKSKLIAKLTERHSAPPSRAKAPRRWIFGFSPSTQRQLAAVAAALLLAIGVGFFLGASREKEHERLLLSDSAEHVKALGRQLEDARSQLVNAKRNVVDTSNHTDSLEAQLKWAEKNNHDLVEAKAAVETQLRAETAVADQKSAQMTSLAGERDALVQQIHSVEARLESVRQELKSAKDEQQKAVLLTATYQVQVDRLNEQLKDREQVMHRDEQYLASDRDVRELMGARQLYIADVFDVDPQGQTKKPYGRVFYTKGRSLIFYAFDLDQEPGYKEAKAFQVWGKPGAASTEPVNLGIFYLDNEKNRRWALKFENPKVLEEINSLFVTVEPKGGSRRPTNKPFLVAYLHSVTPNHP